MTPCTCHPGNVCASAASCAAARRVEFGENEMPEFVTAIDYADNPSDTTTNLIDVRVPIGTRLSLQAQPTPTEHIKEPYTLAELNERIASNDYNAELLLQHAMLLLNAQPVEVSDEPTEAQIAAGMRELFAGPKPWPSWEVTLKRVYQAMFALRPQAVPMTEGLAEAVAAEREACAAVVDGQYRVLEARRAHAEGGLGGANYAYFVPTMEVIAKCATAIRSRGITATAGMEVA